MEGTEGKVKNIINTCDHDGGAGFPLAALAAGGGMGGLGGGGMVGGLLLGALLRGGRGGLLGGEGGDGCGPAIALTSKLGDIQGEICAAASVVNQNIGALALGLQQAFALTNSGIASISREVCEVGCSIKETVHEENERTRALMTSFFQTQQSERIQELTSRLALLETHRHIDGRSRGVEVEVTQQVNQQQQQQQVQAQFADIHRCLHGLVTEISQWNKTTNQAINFGGTQLASPTNTSNQVGRTS